MHTSSDSLPHSDQVFSEDERSSFQAICDAIHTKSSLQGYFEIVPLSATAATVGIGAIDKAAQRLHFGSLVKTIENNRTTVTVRGMGGRELPNAPQEFRTVNEALTFSKAYFEYMSTQFFSSENNSPPIDPTRENLGEAKDKQSMGIAMRIASFAGIIGMFIAFGVICSLIGFVAYFLTKTKIGTGGAICLALAVALAARVLFGTMLR